MKILLFGSFLGLIAASMANKMPNITDQAYFYGVGVLSDNSLFNHRNQMVIDHLTSPDLMKTSQMNVFELLKHNFECLVQMQKTFGFTGWESDYSFSDQTVSSIEIQKILTRLMPIFSFVNSSFRGSDFGQYNPKLLRDLYATSIFEKIDMFGNSENFSLFFKFLSEVAIQETSGYRVGRESYFERLLKRTLDGSRLFGKLCAAYSSRDNVDKDSDESTEVLSSETTDFNEDPASSIANRFLSMNECPFSDSSKLLRTFDIFNNKVDESGPTEPIVFLLENKKEVVKMKTRLWNLFFSFMADYRYEHREILNDWIAIKQRKPGLEVKRALEALFIRKLVMLNLKNIMVLLCNSIDILANKKTFMSYEIDWSLIGCSASSFDEQPVFIYSPIDLKTAIVNLLCSLYSLSTVNLN